MKKFLVTTVIVLSLCSVHAQQIGAPNIQVPHTHKSCGGKIVSYEHQQLSQSFTVDVVCYFFDTTKMDSVIWKLPNGWTVSSQNGSLMHPYYRGDSMVLSFVVTIPDTINLPFYPQYMEMELRTNRVF